MPLLRIENMTHFFGGLRAVHGYNLTIEPGQISGLIGPNGAGKTTIFNLITGIYRPTEGRVVFNGTDIVGRRPDQITSLGIGRTFQNMRLWRHMTALDHVKLAHYSKFTYGLVGAFLGGAQRSQEENAVEEKAHNLLRMLDVDRYANHIVTGLAYGAQRKVELARALATEAKLLLLDEPTAGMNPEEMAEMVGIIRQIRNDLGLTIFLIEHRMRVVMGLCETIQTLDFGEVIASGTPDEIRSNPRVIEAYLGKEVVT